MIEQVDPDKIEEIVGTKRHQTDHYGKAVSKDSTVYILHPQECLDRTPDLRTCIFSLALDMGIPIRVWAGGVGLTNFIDQTVLLGIAPSGRLIPTEIKS